MSSQTPRRPLQKEITVPAPREQVWGAWTTIEGAMTFFAPRANIRMELGGPYELFFDLDAPPGKQGTEGVRVLSYIPERMLSFEWNAPVEFQELRSKRTWVVVFLDDGPSGETIVRLAHLGWGTGEQWERLYDYFDRAWGIVLARLEWRFAHGPIDWGSPYIPPERPKN